MKEFLPTHRAKDVTQHLILSGHGEVSCPKNVFRLLSEGHFHNSAKNVTKAQHTEMKFTFLLFYLKNRVTVSEFIMEAMSK